jgi:cyclopropane fatty-acyl-phospholipid synthase-like methyltransferase
MPDDDNRPMPKPFSPASARNQDAILAVLREHYTGRTRVLEIGSGTGQHAVHFAHALPQLNWQASDVAANLFGIRQWLDEAGCPNTPPPLPFDINGPPPAGEYDAIFSANTLHIMAWDEVQRLFALLPGLMSPQALLTVYGPFNDGGQFTSPSNAAFDAALRADHPQRGIRDIEAVDTLAQAAGMALVDDRAMPANNRCITWRRVAVTGQ